MPKAKAIGRPRKTNVRDVVDAILYMASTGCQEPDGVRIALRADGLRSLALEMRVGEASAMGAAA